MTGTATIDLLASEESRDMAHRIIRIFASHRSTCYICRNLTQDEKDWIIAHQAAFGRGLSGTR